MRNGIVMAGIYAVLALMLVIGAALPGRRAERPAEETEPVSPVAETTGETAADTAEPPRVYRTDEIVAVFDAVRQEECMMPLEEYVTHVVMAEMEYDAPKEALKAQAVAARTYCLYCLAGGQAHGDTDARVCTDYAHCMAYISDEEAEQRWGEAAAQTVYSAVRAAVRETEGEYLTYEGKPIAALFHASSRRMTESAENVWGTPYPYLVSVPTYEEDEPSVTEVPAAEVQRVMEEAGEAAFSDVLYEDAPVLVLDDAGRVASFRAFGRQIAGTDLRALLGLRSTAFEVGVTGNVFRFTCRGWGHGVGMSQAGAVRLAGSGANYKEILCYYYTGVTLIHA